MLRFELLGVVRAVRDGADVPLGPPAHRTVVASLLIGDGAVVTMESLCRDLWGGAPPTSPRAVIRTYVSRLRRELGPGVIDSVPGGAGYRIPAAAADVDLRLFRDLVRTARSRRDEGDVVGAADVLRSALALWSGRPLGGTGTHCARHHEGRLESLRMEALEMCLVLEVTLGRHHDVVTELVSALSEGPLNERLVTACVVALHRCGRTAEAVDTYHRTRQLLRDELGIDPGPELQEAFAAVLHRRPEVTAARPAGRTSTLPSDVLRLRGRDRAVVAVESGLGRSAVVTIDGMAGVGKSALAAHLAHRLTAEFPGGVLHLDLQAHAAGRRPLSPWDAATSLLRQVGEPAVAVDSREDRLERLHEALARRPALVVLDDVASSAQVVDVLPRDSHSRAIVTSRRQLVLDRARSVTLDVLDVGAGVALLDDVVGLDEMSPALGVASLLVRLCTGLPLALTIAAARLRQRPAWNIAHLADRMRDPRRRLRELTLEGRDVADSILRSCAGLSPVERRVLDVLALSFPAEADAEDVWCALVDDGIELDEVDVETALERLLSEHLVRQDRADFYYLNDLVRLAVQQAAPRSPAVRPPAAVDGDE